jgi:hypothetical protein
VAQSCRAIWKTGVILKKLYQLVSDRARGLSLKIKFRSEYDIRSVTYGGPENKIEKQNLKIHFHIFNTFQNLKHNSIIIERALNSSQHILKLKAQFDN